MGLRVKRSDNFIPRVMRKLLRVDFITLTVTSHVARWLAPFQIFQTTIRAPPATPARGTRMVYVDEHVARWRQRRRCVLLLKRVRRDACVLRARASIIDGWVSRSTRRRTRSVRFASLVQAKTDVSREDRTA